MNFTDVPTAWEGEVAVYGGGPAGIAAATAAARGGADVLLIEKNGYLGGVATAAGVTVFHSLWSPDHQIKVIGGLTEEFLDRLVQIDAAYNLRDDGRDDFVVETEYAKFVADELVIGAGAKMLLHTFLVDATRVGERITGAMVANKSGLGVIRARVHVDATDPWQLSDAELEARRQLRWMVNVLRADVPGYQKATIVDIGAQLGLRETRRLLGRHVLTADELLSQQRFDDAIAQGGYPVDIHAADGVGIAFRHLDGRERRFEADGKWHHGYWTADGKPQPAVCYQIPYRSLISDACANLLAAGRPISVDAAAHGATRVMVNCMQTGEAAGVAAALAVASQSPDVRTVDVAAVQRALVAAGMPLQGEGA